MLKIKNIIKHMFFIYVILLSLYQNVVLIYSTSNDLENRIEYSYKKINMLINSLYEIEQIGGEISNYINSINTALDYLYQGEISYSLNNSKTSLQYIEQAEVISDLVYNDIKIFKIDVINYKNTLRSRYKEIYILILMIISIIFYLAWKIYIFIYKKNLLKKEMSVII